MPPLTATQRKAFDRATGRLRDWVNRRVDDQALDIAKLTRASRDTLVTRLRHVYDTFLSDEPTLAQARARGAGTLLDGSIDGTINDLVQDMGARSMDNMVVLLDMSPTAINKFLKPYIDTPVKALPVSSRWVLQELSTTLTGGGTYTDRLLHLGEDLKGNVRSTIRQALLNGSPFEQVSSKIHKLYGIDNLADPHFVAEKGESLYRAEARRCMTGDTLVAGNFSAASRFLYSGQIRKIKTASGQTLSVTPNHRVPTLSGWRSAAQLSEGDHLLSYLGGYEEDVVMGRPGPVGVTASSPHYEQHRPARVDEVFEALYKAGTLTTTGGSDHEFDGDSLLRQGYVEVVTLNRELVDRAKITQQGQDLALVSSNPAASGFHAGTGERDLMSRGLGDAAHSSHSRSGVGVSSEPPTDLSRFRMSAQSDAAFLEVVQKASRRDSSLGRHLLDAHADLVALDEIVEIRDVETQCHVYDLQSCNGLIIADNILIGNCWNLLMGERAKDLDVTEVWFTTLDEVTTPGCAARHGIPMEELSTRPPVHMNCRCGPALVPRGTDLSDYRAEAEEWLQANGYTMDDALLMESAVPGWGPHTLARLSEAEITEPLLESEADDGFVPMPVHAYRYTSLPWRELPWALALGVSGARSASSLTEAWRRAGPEDVALRFTAIAGTRVPSSRLDVLTTREGWVPLQVKGWGAMIEVAPGLMVPDSPQIGASWTAPYTRPSQDFVNRWPLMARFVLPSDTGAWSGAVIDKAEALRLALLGETSRRVGEAWDPAQHPRADSGEHGGEFVTTGGGSVHDSQEFFAGSDHAPSGEWATGTALPAPLRASKDKDVQRVLPAVRSAILALPADHLDLVKSKGSLRAITVGTKGSNEYDVRERTINVNVASKSDLYGKFPDDLETRVRVTAVHEFGHALHEAMWRDAPIIKPVVEYAKSDMAEAFAEAYTLYAFPKGRAWLEREHPEAAAQMRAIFHRKGARRVGEAEWDPKDHPKQPAGAPEGKGGEFAPKGGGGASPVHADDLLPMPVDELPDPETHSATGEPGSITGSKAQDEAHKILMAHPAGIFDPEKLPHQGDAMWFGAGGQYEAVTIGPVNKDGVTLKVAHMGKPTTFSLDTTAKWIAGGMLTHTKPLGGEEFKPPGTGGSVAYYNSKGQPGKVYEPGDLAVGDVVTLKTHLGEYGGVITGNVWEVWGPHATSKNGGATVKFVHSETGVPGNYVLLPGTTELISKIPAPPVAKYDPETIQAKPYTKTQEQLDAEAVVGREAVEKLVATELEPYWSGWHGYKVIADGEDYERTQRIAEKLSLARSADVGKERGLTVKFSEAAGGANSIFEFPAWKDIAPEMQAHVKEQYLKTGGMNAGRIWEEAKDQDKSRLMDNLIGHGKIPDVDVPVSATTMRRIGEAIWGGWKTDSHSRLGMALQVAVADELGAHTRFSPGTHEGVRRDTDDDLKSLGGYAALKAYVRGLWDTSQFLQDKAGVRELEIFRAVMLPGEAVKATRHVQVGERSPLHQKMVDVTSPMGMRLEGIGQALPDLPLTKSGAASFTADPGVANNWNGIGSNMPMNPERVVIKATVPATAVLSLPVYGANIHGEKEVVVLGLPWKDWTAFHNQAPGHAILHTSESARQAELFPADDGATDQWMWQNGARQTAAPTVVIDLDGPHWLSVNGG